MKEQTLNHARMLDMIQSALHNSGCFYVCSPAWRNELARSVRKKQASSATAFARPTGESNGQENVS